MGTIRGCWGHIGKLCGGCVGRAVGGGGAGQGMLWGRLWERCVGGSELIPDHSASSSQKLSALCPCQLRATHPWSPGLLSHTACNLGCSSPPPVECPGPTTSPAPAPWLPRKLSSTWTPGWPPTPRLSPGPCSSQQKDGSQILARSTLCSAQCPSAQPVAPTSHAAPAEPATCHQPADLRYGLLCLSLRL